MGNAVGLLKYPANLEGKMIYLMQCSESCIKTLGAPGKGASNAFRLLDFNVHALKCSAGHRKFFLKSAIPQPDCKFLNPKPQFRYYVLNVSIHSRKSTVMICRVLIRHRKSAITNSSKSATATRNIKIILISILSIHLRLKIMERFVYARIEPIVDPLHPQEQAGFRRGRSTTDQVTFLTQGIEVGFSAKKKAGAVFVDLTTAYDTVWHRGLTCKLLRILPDKHIVSFVIELARNRSFTFTTGNGAQSRLRRLKNGVPQGSVPAPFFYNVYTHDPPVTVARKYAYADDQAIMHSAEDWQS